jgi:hypothetical protein
VTAGLVSTLPSDASLPDRALSLASGRQVDAAALEGTAPEGGDGGGGAAADRMRRANPDARFGGLPPPRVLAAPGMEAAGLLAIGAGGVPPPAAPLPATGPLALGPGELLVVAVPDAAGLDGVLARVGAPGGASARVLVVGLESPPGRARTAPLLLLGGTRGVATSDSTRRAGLVAFQDVRPTLTGSVAGTEGAPIRSLPRADPLASVGHLDQQVAALVSARTLAVVLYAVLGTAALAACLAALLLASGASRRPARVVSAATPSAAEGVPGAAEGVPSAAEGVPGAEAAGAEGRRGWVEGAVGPARRLARALVVASLAVPSGYLIASAVAPTSWVAWLLLGLAASAVFAVAAWLVARRTSATPAAAGSAAAGRAAAGSAAAGSAAAGSAATGPAAARQAGPGHGTDATAAGGAEGRPAGGRALGGGWTAPALLGALVTGLVVLDLLAGGHALVRPLLGNSAFDGERFYGLGNGYFAHALAGVFLVMAFRPLPAWASAALLAGLAVVDGLPSLGADVGGALTAMLSAAAAWLLLGGSRPSLARILWLALAAALAAAVVVLGVAAVTGETTHGSQVARDLGSDPGAALRAVGHQLSGNFGLLAANFWAWWGPLLVAFAGLSSVRPPAPLAAVPVWVRRVVGVGAIGSALLILLNDTGVTAAAGSGLALVMTLAWSALEPARAADPARWGPVRAGRGAGT